ncbi:MAG TPA: (2Fe-2S) ferredoxin domain-containing protein [Bacteroidales bacterium]|nr:(2Fe-2S) ferredoxin domain-containing protein [Bacteroidales bacterium]
MNNQDEISICLGSSCFSRGNNATLEIIKNYLRDRNIKSNVSFKGHLCAGKCKMGPVIEINGKLIYNVSEKNIIAILDNHLTKETVEH